LSQYRAGLRARLTTPKRNTNAGDNEFQLRQTKFRYWRRSNPRSSGSVSTLLDDRLTPAPAGLEAPRHRARSGEMGAGGQGLQRGKVWPGSNHTADAGTAVASTNSASSCFWPLPKARLLQKLADLGAGGRNLVAESPERSSSSSLPFSTSLGRGLSLPTRTYHSE
jgi:hypothetical protein